MGALVEMLFADDCRADGVVAARVEQVATVRFPRPSMYLQKPGGARPTEKWCSTLGQADLDCLLRVIEGQLIPKLVRNYAPARMFPMLPTLEDDRERR